ncbi:queuine tRNA-ribosyltransferase, putative [Plasmodium berghei]|uniref:Queuine tRNA-ribosyltransferase, putative n=2 Tax=Plasmodium berghei TaxID=5821 RepID=A0A509AQW1_PLABA|nr:queuine tRNA-ribosyltransferase, putative [Plasmodium berghei ANKA]CXI50628.1 queuine tRNA-ribosyltransferase, putative [Plasmodium berghei]SCL94295.1 queuine tRNA-ribosyltransferase, putative [Plasmodium berghei]SCM15982.1 queuine tRNA-ribosyltransferase, putative [Plasmodium berghei]SCM17778.1 queuine tRNA-ribosyltransferase, putative [Plasmodium berghei]SCN26007.1 queuine tRNA-ribosyltransferase, putative [Plasmodium berghei]|eukprot:XP_034421907.1 queuine tRNA-ribosyltransferase, putative [Plasmodium berghei ANKA]
MDENNKYRVNKIFDLETPTTTILTNDMLPEFINLELLRKIEEIFILNCPLSEIYNNLNVYEKAKEHYLKNNIKGKNSYLHNFCDFKNSYRYMNIRNVLANNFNLNINKFITLKDSNSNSTFSIDDFIKCIEIFEPNILCIPTEEIKINEQVGKKKKIRIVTIMNDFLEKIKIIKEKNNGNDGALCILSVPSTININNAIKETIDKYDSIINGYLLSGIGYDESNQVRTSYIKDILEVIPENKLKFIQLSNGNPIEILHSIYYGIDIIESNFPYYLARNGKAITMDINLKDINYEQSKSFDINLINFEDKKINDTFIIDLNDSKYALDYSIISNNSPRKETKSYIHHLLKCKELTANVIISYHNLYIYKLFFQEIKSQIKNNTFLTYINTFIQHHKLYM